MDNQARGWLAELHDRRVRLEKLLLGIMVHGPGIVWEDEAQAMTAWLRSNYVAGYQQVHEAYREAVYGQEHANDCACWDCVLRLNAEVTRHRMRMQVREEARGEFD